MTAALGPYLTGCAVLVVAGLAKAWRPGTTALVLAALWPRTPLGLLSPAVRAGATAEVVLGVAAALWPRPALAAAVALSYGTFAAFVAWARRHGGVLNSCGCLGSPDTPATLVHVVVDLGVAAAAAVVAAGGGTGELADMLGHQPLDGAPLLSLAALGTALVLLAMTSLARLGPSGLSPNPSGTKHR